ncbi:MAG: sulfite exporter TauE/SafE family protein [Planctomycetota bacterium]
MSALLMAVAGASLLGSLHCAGMCGGFVGCTLAAGGGGRERRLRLQVAYNGGRFITYLLLGAVAGAAGGGLDRAGVLVGLQRAAAVTAGAVIALWGIHGLLLASGRKIRIPAPRSWERWTSGARRVLARLLGGLRERPPLLRAFLLGLSATILPCGWLYAFAVTAAGSGSAAGGTLVMAAFWLGTVPMMAGLGLGLDRLLQPIRRRAPALTSAALVAVGIFTLLGRVHSIGAAPADHCGTGSVPVESSFHPAPAHAEPILEPPGHSADG